MTEAAQTDCERRRVCACREYCAGHLLVLDTDAYITNTVSTLLLAHLLGQYCDDSFHEQRRLP